MNYVSFQNKIDNLLNWQPGNQLINRSLELTVKKKLNFCQKIIHFFTQSRPKEAVRALNNLRGQIHQYSSELKNDEATKEKVLKVTKKLQKQFTRGSHALRKKSKREEIEKSCKAIMVACYKWNKTGNTCQQQSSSQNVNTSIKKAITKEPVTHLINSSGQQQSSSQSVNTPMQKAITKEPVTHLINSSGQQQSSSQSVNTPIQKAITKEPVTHLINSSEHKEFLADKRYHLKHVENAEIIKILKNDPLEAWKKYLAYQGNKPHHIGVSIYKWIPPYELLQSLAFDVWKNSEKLIKVWPSQFIRDCAIVHPNFAADCFECDLLWECLRGCSDEVVDICKVNSSAAWKLIQRRTEMNYRPDKLLMIFHGAHKAILNEPFLSSLQVQKLVSFLSNCTFPLKEKDFNLLSTVAIAHPDSAIQNLREKWKNQGIY